MKIKDYNDAIEFFRTNDYKAADGAWSEFYQSEVQEPRIMDLAEGGRIGFDPGGTVKKDTGPTKKNVGNTSPVKKGKFKYPRKNKYGTVWSDTRAGGSRRNLIEMRGIGNEIIEKFKKGWSSVQLEDLYGLDNDTILDYIKEKQPRLKVAKADKRRLNQWKYDKSIEPKIAEDAKNMSRRQILEKWGNKISKKKLDSLVKEGKITFGIVEESGRPRIPEGEKSEKVKKRQRRIWNVQRGEFSGTFAKNFHHIYPIGGMADFSPQDTMILDKKFNEILGGDNLRLNDIADEIADIDFSKKGALEKLDALNAESKMIVDRAKAKLPKELKNAIGFIRYEPIFDEYGTVINFNQIREGVDDTSGSLGKFSEKKFKDFTPDERTSFRKFVKEEALETLKKNPALRKEVQTKLTSGVDIDEILKSPAVKKAMPWIKGEGYFAVVEALNNWTKGQSFKKGAQKAIETGTFGLLDLAADEKALVDYAERQGLSKKEIDAMRNYLYYMKELQNNKILNHKLKFREDNQGDSTQIVDYGEQIFSAKDVEKAKDKVAQSDEKLQQLTDKYFETSFVGDEGARVLQNMMEGLTAEEWNKPAGTMFDRGNRLDQGSGSIWDLFNMPFSNFKENYEYLNPAIKKPQQELMIKHPVYGYKEQIKDMEEKGIYPMEDINYSMEYALPKAQGGIASLNVKKR